MQGQRDAAEPGDRWAANCGRCGAGAGADMSLKVFVLMAAMTALFVVVGGALGGSVGMWVAFAVAALMNFVAWFNSDKAALRAYGAQIVSQADAPQLFEIVDRLSQRTHLPTPRIAIAPQTQPNAFASGRNEHNAVVCVTAGLLERLDLAELEGVLAHEIAHIKNRDMLLQTFSATLAGAVGMMSRFGVVSSGIGGNGNSRGNPLALILALILAPIAAMLIQFAISRSREFKADATGAEISGDPLSLAAALGKIDAAAKRLPMAVSPTMAPLAQVDPLQAVGGGIGRMFSTHPPVEERIARLRGLAAAV
jgi:heat shock protein HtpX